jgi:hypothetical protein
LALDRQGSPEGEERDFFLNVEGEGKRHLTGSKR